jgi:hypothetical protein
MIRFRPDAPTEELDAFVAEARVATIDAELEPSEISAYLRSTDPAERFLGS